ncbi:MAG: Ig-like domain-containing protein, partial [Clostridia bacterium]|nr:Ig-like domain-containing protein [Clostridia bacterium]
TYKSSNTSVATVSASGLVTAVAAGECTITVSDGVNSKICTITVVNSDAAKLTGISADGMILDLNNSTSASAAKLTATVTGEGAESVTVTWTSDNTAVATVDQNGNVTAVAAGVANITASDGKNDKTCKVVVGDSARTLGDYVLGGTAADASADPEKWYGYGDNDTAFVANYTDDKVSVTKASGAEKSFYLFYQPLLPVGTRYNVSITVTRDGGKNLGTVKRFQFGTGTVYNASADPTKVEIVTDNAGTNYQQNSLTVSGTFTVSGNEPFYISFRTTNTGFTFEVTFTPVSEESTAQVSELEALPATGKENG